MMKIKLIAIAFLIQNLASCGKSGGATPVPEQDPKITIDDVVVTEGNGNTAPFEFTVRLDKATSKTVTVNYSTVDGTATSGTDYTLVYNQTLTFQPNETAKKVNVAIIGDDIKEEDETFSIILSNAVNATIQKTTGTGIIKNDDTKIAIVTNGYDAPTSYPGYTLKWGDEFNGNALDMNAWGYDLGDGCPNICGWGNNELEYYTSRPENIYLQDGKLIIEAKNENFNGKNYTSAKIKTQGKQVFKFGRVDIRAVLPKGKGIWPALWMLPESSVYGNWPKSGEIDIMELLGQDPAKVYATVHYGPGPGSTQFGRNFTLSSGTFNDAFHVFSIEWKQDQIKWLIDNNVYATFNKSDAGTLNYPFNESFFFIFNVAVGGQWPGSPDGTTTFPQRMIVDYIRVYQ